MVEALVFTILKIIELIVYLIAFPFLFIGTWGNALSDVIGNIASEFDTRKGDDR
jgi:hypothetical protein